MPGLRGIIALGHWLAGGLPLRRPLGLFALLQLLAWTATRLGERQLALAARCAGAFTAVLTVAQVAL
jgi:hypothetical protein